MAKRILFAGLGNMGFPMARNLRTASFDVFGFDVSTERIAQIEKLVI